MRNLKKIVSLALALMMVLSMMVTASAAFADADEISYKEAVEVMSELNILLGDGTNFNPKGTLTRDQAAKILAVIHSGVYTESYFTGETKYVENPFTDVKGWASPYVLYCYANNIVGGTSATTFTGSKNLTGYEFAKMLLVAAGYGKHADYVGDAEQTWQMKVLSKAKEADLLSGLNINMNSALTREEASQMALNAMKAGGTETVTYYVVDSSAALDENETPDAFLLETDSVMEAYVTASVVGGKVQRVIEVTGSLLKENFDVTYGISTDTYGRTSLTYVFNASDADNTYATYFPYASTLKYSNTTKATDIAADIKGLKMKGTENGTDWGTYTVGRDTVVSWIVDSVVVDGTAVADPTAATSAAGFIAALTGPNTVVEVYTNNKNVINNIVVVNTYVDQITAVQAMDLEAGKLPLAYIGEDVFLNLAGYKKGDVVSFNIDSTGIINVAPATGVVATATSYTSTGIYTVNGNKYTLGNKANEELIQTSVAKAKELVYYFGANNTIQYVTNVATSSVETPDLTDYAYVLDTLVWKSKDGSTTGGLNATTTVDEYTADIQVLLADGTTAIWQVPVSYATKAIAAYGISKGDYYVIIAKNVYKFTKTDANIDQTLAALEGNVYTYADNTLAAAVATTLTKKSGVIAADVSGLTGNTVSINGVVYNSKTSIIVKKGTGYQVVTGVSALKTDSIDGTAIITQTYNAKTDSYIKVASLVFAPTATLTPAATTIDSSNLVLSDGTYVVTYDAKGNAHYTYTVVNSKGEAIEVEGDGLIGVGIYALASDGKLYSEINGTKNGYDIATGVVTGIFEEIVQYTDVYTEASAYTIISSKTVVTDLTGKGLVVGSTIIFANGLIFVIG